MDDTTSFDPFAVLRAIENGHSDQAESLFTGSEPVPAEPAQAAPAEPVAAPATPAPAPAPAPEPSPAAQLSATQIDAVVRDALLALEDRIAALEALAKRNGWPL